MTSTSSILPVGLRAGGDAVFVLHLPPGFPGTAGAVLSWEGQHTVHVRESVPERWPFLGDHADLPSGKEAAELGLGSARERPSRIQTHIRLTRLLPGLWNCYPLTLPVTKATFCPDRASNSRAGVEVFFLVSFSSFWMTTSPQRSHRTGVPPLPPGAGTMAQWMLAGPPWQAVPREVNLELEAGRAAAPGKTLGWTLNAEHCGRNPHHSLHRSPPTFPAPRVDTASMIGREQPGRAQCTAGRLYLGAQAASRVASAGPLREVGTALSSFLALLLNQRTSLPVHKCKRGFTPSFREARPA